MTKQAMNYLLGELERLGYLIRRDDPEDRRSKRVHLTAAAATSSAAIRSTVREIEASGSRSSAPDRLARLRELLQRPQRDADGARPAEHRGLNAAALGRGRHAAAAHQVVAGAARERNLPAAERNPERRRPADPHPERARTPAAGPAAQARSCPATPRAPTGRRTPPSPMIRPSPRRSAPAGRGGRGPARRRAPGWRGRCRGRPAPRRRAGAAAGTRSARPSRAPRRSPRAARSRPTRPRAAASGGGAARPSGAARRRRPPGPDSRGTTRCSSNGDAAPRRSSCSAASASASRPRNAA